MRSTLSHSHSEGAWSTGLLGDDSLAQAGLQEPGRWPLPPSVSQRDQDPVWPHLLDDLIDALQRSHDRVGERRQLRLPGVVDDADDCVADMRSCLDLLNEL